MHAILPSVFLIFPICSHSVENRTLLGGQMACEKRVFLTNWATGSHIRFWPKADKRWCTANVRFWGKSGHAVFRCKCLLLTQSGHFVRLPEINRSATFLSTSFLLPPPSKT